MLFYEVNHLLEHGLLLLFSGVVVEQMPPVPVAAIDDFHGLPCGSVGEAALVVDLRASSSVSMVLDRWEATELLEFSTKQGAPSVSSVAVRRGASR